MNLIFVATAIPYPPDKNGFTENIFYLTKTIKELYDVNIKFIIFNKSENDSNKNEFKKYVDELVFKRPTSKYLYPIIKYRYTKDIQKNFVLFCDFNAGYYHRLFPKSKKILYSADSPTLNYSKRKGIKARLFYLKYIFEETMLYPKFQHVVFVSDLDIQFSKKRTKNNGIHVPIGYDADRAIIAEKKEYDLIFSGNFSYQPNSLAAELFMDNNVKELVEIFPEIKICFVGREPSKQMKDFALKWPANIIVTGEVENLETYLGKAKVYVSPLQNGSGMKNKILQAMAARLPIIGTRESISGFNEYPVKSTIIVNLKNFNKEIENLLRMDNQELKKLGQINRNFMKAHYSWEAVVAKHYKKLLSIDED